MKRFTTIVQKVGKSFDFVPSSHSSLSSPWPLERWNSVTLICCRLTLALISRLSPCQAWQCKWTSFAKSGVWSFDFESSMFQLLPSLQRMIPNDSLIRQRSARPINCAWGLAIASAAWVGTCAPLFQGTRRSQSNLWSLGYDKFKLNCPTSEWKSYAR